MKNSIKEKFIFLFTLCMFLFPSFSFAESKFPKESENRSNNPISNFLDDFERSLKKRYKEYELLLNNQSKSEDEFGIDDGYIEKEKQEEQLDLVIRIGTKSFMDASKNALKENSLVKKAECFYDRLSLEYHKKKFEKPSFNHPFNKDERKSKNKEVYGGTFSLKGVRAHYKDINIDLSYKFDIEKWNFSEGKVKANLSKKLNSPWGVNLNLYEEYNRESGFYTLVGISKNW